MVQDCPIHTMTYMQNKIHAAINSLDTDPMLLLLSHFTQTGILPLVSIPEIYGELSETILQ
jgi:hypothetical protein